MFSFLKRFDYILLGSILTLSLCGLFVINDFSGDNTRFFKQSLFVVFMVFVYGVFSLIDSKIWRRKEVVRGVYFATISMLLLLFVLGKVSKGALSWFSFGGISFQPAEFAAFALILFLSKYFAKRHVQIADFTHIVVSGIYAAIPVLLILVQPDFGNALILFLLWLLMVLVSGMSFKHIMVVLGFGAAGFVLLWAFVLAPYQKARLETFLNPVADIRGSGYNVNQAMIAFGSGETLGKGLGFGTQSRLKFLPEYQTDFVIAAFAEEWGFLGMVFFFSFFTLLLGRLLYLAHFAATNFERLFILGTILLFMVHLVINVGMNMGIMPVTGITLPFLSYGGSHLMIEGMLLGIITSMTQYSRVAHPEKMHNEFFGLEK